MTFLEVSGVNEPSSRQEHELIKECNNIATGLVNREDHRAIVVTSQRYKTFDNVIGVIGIKTACGFIQEEYRRRCDELTCDGDAALFATGYGPTSCSQLE